MHCWLARPVGALVCLLAFTIMPALAQTVPSQDVPTAPVQPSDRVRVYLDCPGGGGPGRGGGPGGGGFQDQCFSEYLREQIDFVDFVRQPQDAEVHVLASGQETGGGGREVVLRFVGRERFVGHDHALRAITQIGDTENARREVVLRTVIIGLLDFVAHDGIPPGVNLSVTTETAEGVAQVPVEDPWNLWVFSVRLNVSMDEDERSRGFQAQLNFSGDRITPEWKVSLGGRVNEDLETFDLDEDDPFEVSRRDRNLNGFIARSLGPYWSVGVRGRVASSTFNNNRFSVTAAPAIEYSVFPYREYATRELRIQYNAGIARERYHEITIFGKLRETLGRHELSATLDQRQPWGSLRAGFEFSQYVHDWSKYRLEGNGNMNVRLTRGLSLNANGSASRVRDQLSLPLRDATDEEVLLRIRQLQSGYQVRFSFGVTYSFGSIFNNVINPRFGN